MDGSFGPDLEALVGGRPAPLVRFACISRHGATGETRETFRLDFADGTTLKGRRVRSPAIARRVEEIVGKLDPGRFPRVVGRRGMGLLEEWVPGETLEAGPPAPHHLRWAAETLGAVHAVTTRGADGRRWMQARVRVLARHLTRLAEEGALAGTEARRLEELARADAPRESDFAIIHRDVCPENIVIDPSGRLHLVDNAAVRFGAPAEDLARTCYRWPLDAAGRAMFLETYGALRDPRTFTEHRRFWMIAALAHAAWIRHFRRYARPDVPIRHLRAELGDTPCCTSPTAPR